MFFCITWFAGINCIWTRSETRGQRRGSRNWREKLQAPWLAARSTWCFLGLFRLVFFVSLVLAFECGSGGCVSGVAPSLRKECLGDKKGKSQAEAGRAEVRSPRVWREERHVQRSAITLVAATPHQLRLKSQCLLVVSLWAAPPSPKQSLWERLQASLSPDHFSQHCLEPSGK